MLFYDSPNPAPNPRRVRIFAAEKGIAWTEIVGTGKGPQLPAPTTRTTKKKPMRALA